MRGCRPPPSCSRSPPRSCTRAGTSTSPGGRTPRPPPRRRSSRAAILLLPIAIATWDVDADAIPFMAVSAALELLYLALLAAAYGRAELTRRLPGGPRQRARPRAARRRAGRRRRERPPGGRRDRRRRRRRPRARPRSRRAQRRRARRPRHRHRHRGLHGGRRPRPRPRRGAAYLQVVVGVPAVVYAAAVLPRRGRVAVRRELTPRALAGRRGDGRRVRADAARAGAGARRRPSPRCARRAS